MEEGPKRADDQRRWFVEREVGHVAEVEHQFNTGLVGRAAGRVEHRR
jgi:hypothetical protein